MKKVRFVQQIGNLFYRKLQHCYHQKQSRGGALVVTLWTHYGAP